MHRSRGIIIGLWVCTVLLGAGPSMAQTSATRDMYLEYARESANWTWDNYDNLIDDWRDNFDSESIFGYRPPNRLLEMAVIYAYLFEEEGVPV